MDLLFKIEICFFFNFDIFSVHFFWGGGMRELDKQKSLSEDKPR